MGGNWGQPYPSLRLIQVSVFLPAVLVGAAQCKSCPGSLLTPPGDSANGMGTSAFTASPQEAFFSGLTLDAALSYRQVNTAVEIGGRCRVAFREKPVNGGRKAFPRQNQLAQIVSAAPQTVSGGF